MSNSMEREKNERLTAREIEEEEMKRELTGIGIYEPGFTYKHMKKLLGFLNESKDTSNTASNNKNVQKGTQHSDNEYLLEIKSDANESQEVSSQECTELSRSSYSYKLSHTSPTMHDRNTIRSSSPESSYLFEVRNPTNRRKSSDNDEVFEKQQENSIHSTNRTISLRSGNIPRGCQNTAERRTAQDTQDELNQKVERWQLNPLEVFINENDVPLQQPNRSSARECVLFKCCKEVHTSEQRDQAVRAVSRHLKKMAELWYSWHHSSINYIFQWGSPIQVGTANGSLDRKPLTDPKTEQIKAECSYRDNHERVSKRKASSLITNQNKESSTEEESDEQYDLAYVKKKRMQSDNKTSNINRAANQHAHVATHEKAISSVIASQKHSNDENSDTSLDNEHVKSLTKKSTGEKDKSISPELVTYPRRIVPPNPKTRLSLSRQRRGNAVLKSFPKMRRTCGSKVTIEQAKSQKKDNVMTDEEIRRKLEDCDNDNKAVVEKNMEIRPLPISKEIQTRLQEKRRSSNKTGIIRDSKVTVKEDSDGEQNKEKRLKVREQRKKEEELCRTQNRNGSWEHQLMSDDEDELLQINQELDMQNGNQSHNASIPTININCPICNKLFPNNEIEDHAADCEQFEMNNEEDDNNIDLLQCNICSDYKTYNGIDYEEHVQQCIVNNSDKRHSRGSEDVDTASTSSLRTYKPISEQKDSEIDYFGQLPSNSRTKIYSGKKRKR